MTVFGALIRALRLVLADTSLRRLAMRPWLIGFLSYIVLAAVAISSVSSIVAWLVGEGGGFWFSVLFFVTWVFVFALSLGAVTLGSFLFVCLGASYFQDALVRRALQVGNIQPPKEREGLKELGRSVGHEVAKFLVFLPLLVMTLALGVFAGVFPLLAPVVFLLGGWTLGFQLFDPLLEVYGLKLSARLRFGREYALSLLSMGGMILLAAIVPFLGFFLFPIAVVAAALFLSESEAMQHFVNTHQRSVDKIEHR